jgi:hypothetical protein
MEKIFVQVALSKSQPGARPKAVNDIGSDGNEYS